MGDWDRWGAGSEARPARFLLTVVLCTVGCGRVGYDGVRSVDDDGALGDAADAVSFARLCEFGAHVIIENGIAADNDVGRQLHDAIEAGCDSGVTQTTVSQNDAASVDADTGRPLTPPEDLIVLGGGDGPHRVVRYLLQGDTPLIWEGVAPVTITIRATGRVVLEGPTNDDLDYILMQVVEEPIGGTISVSGQGLQVNGTRAAALYFEQVVAPGIRQEGTSWMVIEWVDSDVVAGASVDDTYTLIESG